MIVTAGYYLRLSSGSLSAITIRVLSGYDRKRTDGPFSTLSVQFSTLSVLFLSQPLESAECLRLSSAALLGLEGGIM